MNDSMWIKLECLNRCNYEKVGDDYVRVPLPSIWRMCAKAQRRRFYINHYNSRLHENKPEGWHVERFTDEQMIAEGWRKVPRSFNGEVIIRPDCGYADSVQVQLPAEYGDTVVVRMYGSTLATCVCEGLVVGDRIRGPFRLLELGGTMTLTLRS